MDSSTCVGSSFYSTRAIITKITQAVCEIISINIQVENLASRIYTLVTMECWIEINTDYILDVGQSNLPNHEKRLQDQNPVKNKTN